MFWDEFNVNVNQNGTVTSSILDVTFDFPRDTALASTAVDSPMAEFLRGAYMLRRVVGSVFVSLSLPLGIGADDLTGAAVTYGLFVARADEVNDNAIPIGAGNQAEINQNYNPQNNENVREPYIFQRSWILGTNNVASRPGEGAIRFPMNNAGYGSAMEGTHVDQRTLRRIEGDNRLWHIVSVRNYPLREVHTTGNPFVRVNTALRFLGRPASMARAKGSF